jgi:lipopolysaccharide heptosyltransferase I
MSSTSLSSPLSEYPARRIALIKPSALGDIIHSLPVLTALRRRYPDAHISWIVNRAYQPLLDGHPDLNATLAFDRAAFRRGWITAATTYTHFFRLLRRQRFDLVIDLQGLGRSAVMTLATRSPRRVGLSSAREGAVWSYTDVVTVPDFQALHAVDRYWLIAEAFGAGDAARTFHVPVTEKDRTWVAEALHRCPRPWLMFGIGARWMTKRWPPDHFAVLARLAQEQFGGTAVLVGGRDEVALARKMRGLLTGSAVDLTGKTELPQLAAVLADADVMVANDTGPLHLAAALGRPVVAPYTCTQVCRTGPYGAPGGAVESRVWCQGSCIKRCPRLECMAELTPDRLWPILQEILQRCPNQRRSA